MPFQKYSIEKDELVNLFQKWRHLLILWKGNTFTYVLDSDILSFCLCVGGYDLLLAGCDLFYLGLGGCGWVRPFLARCGWVWMSVTFFWVGVGECDLFWLGVGRCGWVWPFFGWVWVSVTFFWLVWVGVGECDLFLTGCGWVWVSVGEYTVYNCPY